MQQKRNLWLDVAKAITIILMVLGHTSIPRFLSNFIWSFHMPLFFIASGWTTNWDKDGILKFGCRKFKSIILPFVIYSTVVLFIKKITLGEDFVSWLLNGWGGYALWFIPVLYFSLVICKLIYSTNKYIFIASVIILVLIGVYFAKSNLILPWTMSSVPIATFFVAMGTVLRRYQRYIDTPSWSVLIIGFSISIIVSSFYRLDIATNMITPVLPILIAALSGTIAMFTMSSYLVKYSTKITTVFKKVGYETYVIVAFSQIIIMLLNVYFKDLNSIVKYIFLVILLYAICLIKNQIIILINKIHS